MEEFELNKEYAYRLIEEILFSEKYYKSKLR